MSLLIMTLLIMSSCQIWQDRPHIAPVERCSVSFQFEKCRCVQYDIYNAKTEGEGYDKPLEYCEDIVGFKAEDWLKDISPWAKENIRMYDDNRRK